MSGSWVKRSCKRISGAVTKAIRAIGNGIGHVWQGVRALFRWKGMKQAGVVLRALCVVCLSFGIMLFSVSAAVCNKEHGKIRTPEELAQSGDRYDCILVLGCRVYDNGALSNMLEDRMITGTALYHAGVSDTLLVSGDHRTDAYNETGAMKKFAVSNGVPSERVFEDHDGYSTYESIARLKLIYGGKRVVIVTQEYHLYRALYLAEKMGIDAVGVPADLRPYAKQGFREIREILARCKDVYYGARQPAPEVLGDPVSLAGNGDLTAQSRPPA